MLSFSLRLTVVALMCLGLLRASLAGYPAGDINDDLVTNEEDIQVIQKYLNEEHVVLDAISEADANEDGVVDSADLTFIDIHPVTFLPAEKIFGIGSPIYVDFSPDGQRLLIGGTTAKIFDAETGEELSYLTESVSGAAVYSPDGSKVFVRDSLYEASTWTKIREYSPLDKRIGGPLAFISDGERVLVRLADEARAFLNLANGELQPTIDGITAVSSNGERGLNWEKNGIVRIWDLVTSTLIQTIVPERVVLPVYSLSPDGKTVFTNTTASILWDVASGDQLTSLAGSSDLISAAVFSADGTELLTVEKSGTGKIWNVETGDLMSSFTIGPDIHPTPYDMVDLSVSGDKAAATSWLDGFFSIRNISTEETIVIGEEADSWAINSAEFIDQGRKILYCNGREIKIRDSMSGEILEVLPIEGFHMWLSNDKTRMLVENGPTATVFDMETSQVINSFAPFPSSTEMALSPDGSKVAIASTNDEVAVIDVDTSNVVANFSHGTPDNFMRSLTFSPDSARLATGGVDGVIKYWDIAENRLIRSLGTATTNEGVIDAEFSPDGSKIISRAQSGRVVVSDLHSGVPDHVFTRNQGHGTTVGYFPDGETIFILGVNVIIFRDVSSGEILGQHYTGAGGLHAPIKFSPDGDKMLIGSYDSTLRIFDVSEYSNHPVNP